MSRFNTLRVDALVLCDYVYADTGSMRHSILGVLDTLLVDAFPAPCRFEVFMVFSGVGPEVTVLLQIADAETGELVMPPTPLLMGSTAPRGIIRRTLSVEDMEVVKAGTYRFSVIYNDSELAGIDIAVRMREDSQ